MSKKTPFLPKNKDIEELKQLLQELKDYYTDLSKKYSIKNDLVEITDHRYALSKTLEEHISKANHDIDVVLKDGQESLEELSKLKESLSSEISILTNFKDNIESIELLLNSESDDKISYREELEKLLNHENINKLKQYSDDVMNSWTGICKADENGNSILENIQIKSNEINKLYASIFDASEDTLSKEEEIENFHSEILKIYKQLVLGDTKIIEDEEVKIQSYFDEIKEKKSELNKFYKKIYGEDNNSGLEYELEDRLKQLNEIEKEAKKVINLSSDAGLAGGFHQRGKSARDNKWVSLGVFVLALILLGTFNFSTIDFNNLQDITLQSIFIRLVINTPFIWIAVVSNINLNKYSRLEEEYAHKESLAKSFERYKEQIKKLEDDEMSQKLMSKLLETNIDAFQKNAAETMLFAKSDMPSSALREGFKK